MAIPIKKLLQFSLLILGLVFLPIEAEAKKRVITVNNQSGVDIYYIYLGPSTSTEWEYDCTQEYYVKNNQSIECTLSESPFPQYWDIYFERKDEAYRAYYEIDLLKYNTITLYPNKATGSE